MTRNRTLLSLLLVALALAPAVCAQRGPAPGMTPDEYATSYAQSQVDQAAADPAGYASRTASADGAANLTGEVAYIACWSVDDTTGASGEIPVCPAYYTSPGQAERPAEVDNETAAVDDSLASVQELANTTADALQEIVADPTSAPSQLQRVVDALSGFAAGLVATVTSTVTGLVDGVVALVMGIVHGIGIGAQGLGVGAATLYDLVGDGLGAATDGVVATAQGIGDGVVAGRDFLAGAGMAIVNGVVAGITVGIDGIGAGATSVASFVAGAGSAVSDAIATGAEAVGAAAGAAAQAVADAAQAVTDTVSSWFGGGSATGHAGRAADRAPLGGGDEAQSLLKDVRARIPL